MWVGEGLPDPVSVGAFTYRRKNPTVVAIGWSAKRQILGKTVCKDKNARVGKIDDIIITPEYAKA